MKARIRIFCEQCNAELTVHKLYTWETEPVIDTADMPEAVQRKINKLILAHREDCRYYRQTKIYNAGEK